VRSYTRSRRSVNGRQRRPANGLGVVIGLHLSREHGASGTMRSFSIGSSWRVGALALLGMLLVACGGGPARPDMVQASNIPASFDVTVIADKDNQFDLDGAPLTAEDLKSAIRYRLEEKLPTASVILKRGEKEKVKNEHIVALARIAYEMKFRAFVLEKNGEITEVQAQLKDDAKK
jgi:hypothetical protein